MPLNHMYRLVMGLVDHARRPSARECEHLEADRRSAQNIRDNLRRATCATCATVSQPPSAELRGDAIRRYEQTDAEGEFEDAEVEWLDSIVAADQDEVDWHRMAHRFAA